MREGAELKAISELAKEALELPASQRITLARILLDLSEHDQEFSPDVDRAWEEEICRRLKTVEAGTARSRSFEQVFADLDRHLSA